MISRLRAVLAPPPRIGVLWSLPPFPEHAVSGVLSGAGQNRNRTLLRPPAADRPQLDPQKPMGRFSATVAPRSMPLLMWRVDPPVDGQ
jgi:hypothetical protein